MTYVSNSVSTKDTLYSKLNYINDNQPDTDENIYFKMTFFVGVD